MKKLLPKLSLVAMLLLPLQWAVAQSDVPLAAFSATGGSTVTSAGTLVSYTFGQVAFLHFGSDNGNVTEGVQQIFCIPEFDTVEYEVCQDDASDFLNKLPEGYTLPEEVAPTVPGIYKFVLRTLAQGGCDSIVWITLYVHPVLDTTLYAQAEGHYEWFETDYTESGTYQHVLSTIHGCDSNLYLELSITKPGMPLPKIYTYQDRMLMVDHNSGENTVDYGYYRWYRDGELIAEGEDLDNYRKEDGSVLDKGCYHVEVPTTDDDSLYWAASNTICVGLTGLDVARKENIQLSIVPNPVASGNVFRVSTSLAETQLQGAKVCIYDAQGRMVAERAARAETNFQASFASGVYSVHIILPGGKHGAHKLVVR
ncbi:MAG: T9SS type A sorting domain-containing protein [Bacteroidales bacterium]|nr:T9SS type A sorting domain-containing protein [Bacteroidales bacterium]